MSKYPPSGDLFAIGLVAAAILCPLPVRAEMSAEELAKMAQNPGQPVLRCVLTTPGK